MYAVETNLPRDPLWLAQQLWREPGAVLFWSSDGSGPSYLSCNPVEQRFGLDPEPELRWGPPTTALGAQLLQAPRWVGLLPYEAMRSSMERPSYQQPEKRPRPHHQAASWWRYPAFVCVGSQVTIVGEDRSSVQALRKRLNGSKPPLFASSVARCAEQARLHRHAQQEPVAQHRGRIERAIEHILDGDIYEINLARRLVLEVEGSTLSQLAKMSLRAPSAYGFAFEAAGVASTSPELCLETTTARRAVTVPIKGTRPRGADSLADAELRDSLASDRKERAELAMVVDVERNDLGRVADIGSVRASEPVIVRHPTVFHRQALVSARIRDQVSRCELLASMLPSGSITGAPKVRAMELIAELESQRRGLYTGAFGFLRHNGTLKLAMAIRTLTVADGIGHYFVGGGIVLRSDIERELAETEWKALQTMAQ